MSENDTDYRVSVAVRLFFAHTFYHKQGASVLRTRLCDLLER